MADNLGRGFELQRYAYDPPPCAREGCARPAVFHLTFAAEDADGGFEGYADLCWEHLHTFIDYWGDTAERVNLSDA